MVFQLAVCMAGFGLRWPLSVPYLAYVYADISDTNTMNIQGSLRVAVFWIALLGFLSWDWLQSPPVNLRLEAPIIAIGSGQAPSGGHCATF